MRLVAVVLSVLAPLACSGTVQAGRTAPLVNPQPVSALAGASGDAVLKDIKRTLLGRDWTIAAERPGEIDATLRTRDHEAKIPVQSDLQSIRLSYVDSQNLEYRVDRKGNAEIHANDPSWIQSLANDLGVNLPLSQTH